MMFMRSATHKNVQHFWKNHQKNARASFFCTQLVNAVILLALRQAKKEGERVEQSTCIGVQRVRKKLY